MGYFAPVLIAMLWHGQQVGPSSPPAKQFEDEIKIRVWLETKFHLPEERLGSMLVIARDFAVESQDRLYLRSRNGLLRIASPNELAGLVEISSPEAALDFVRLWTSPATVGLFDSDYIGLEPLRTSEVTGDFVFQWQEILARLKVDYAISGVVPDKWTKERFPLAHAYQEGKAFVVSRVLLTSYRGIDPVLSWVKEVVQPDGHVRRVVLRKAPYPESGAWRLSLRSLWPHGRR